MTAGPVKQELQAVSQAWQQVLAPYGIGYRIKLLAQNLSRKFQERLDPFSLTPFHWVVLCCLWQQDGLATSSIGDRLQQVGGTLTGVLDRMEDRGLIRRERDAHDRRIWRIWLTGTGKQLETVLPALAGEIREQALKDISFTDREQFSNLLNRVIVNSDQSGHTSTVAVTAKHPQGWQEVLAPYSLGYRIKLLSQLLSRKFQERLEPFGLTPFHWLVLCCLWQENGLATSSIGDKLQQVGGTLTGVLDRMEERGLIYRQRDPSDRRIWRIWLTADGEALQAVLPPVVAGLLEQAMQGISPIEQAQFSQTVNRILANLAVEV